MPRCTRLKKGSGNKRPTRMKKLVGVINVEPKWTAVARTYMSLLQEGNAEAREFAKGEILDMAKRLDDLRELQKKGKLIIKK